MKTHPKTSICHDETDCTQSSILHVIDLFPILWKIIYSLLFYISIDTIQISFIVSVARKSLSSLCRKAWNF